MKKNYKCTFCFFILLLCMQFGYGQNKLTENKYGLTIEKWLMLNIDKYGLESSDILDIRISDSYYSDKTKINHVYANQAFQGVKIHNAISSISIRDNKVFYFANAFVSNIASKINTTEAFLNPKSAISAVVSKYALGSVNDLQLLSSSGNNYLFSRGNISKEEIPVQLVYQQVEDGSLKLAWDLSIYSNNGKNWYSVRVDALNGEVLSTNDWVVSCNFNDHNHKDHQAHLRSNYSNSID